MTPPRRWRGARLAVPFAGMVTAASCLVACTAGGAGPTSPPSASLAPTARTTSPADATGGSTPTSPPATPSATATAEGASPRPTDLLAGRTLVWSDEFDGAAGAPVSADWEVADGGGGFGNNELQTYTSQPTNVSTTGFGALQVTARSEGSSAPDGAAAYTSARLQSAPAFRYGHIEARIKVPAGWGLWPAFWAIGDGPGDWPDVGEIDVMETINQANFVQADVHGPDSSGDPWERKGSSDVDGSLATSWHVYAVDWSPGQLVFSIDGKEFHRVSRADLAPAQRWVFDHPFHLVLNLAVGGDWPGPPIDGGVFPATMLVDYVRVYDSTVSR